MSTFNNNDYVYDYERELMADAIAYADRKEAEAKERELYAERQKFEVKAKAKFKERVLEAERQKFEAKDEFKAELKAYAERQKAEVQDKWAAKAKNEGVTLLDVASMPPDRLIGPAELKEKLKLFPDPATSRKNDALLLDGNWDDDKWDFDLPPTMEADQKLIDSALGDDKFNPKHYNRGSIEVIDFIEDQGFNYHRGQAIRYLSRAGHKPDNPELDDLKKALWYLEREIKNITEKESDNV